MRTKKGCISTAPENALFHNSWSSFYFQFFQDILRIFKFGKHDHCCNYIWLEASFFIKRDAVAVKYAGIYFTCFTAYTCNISWQAVQVKCLAVFCSFHKLFCASPVLVLCILCKKLFFQFVDSIEIAFSVKVGTLDKQYQHP